MVSKPTTTSFAILGLLSMQPWTAYELVAQSRRSLHWFWPRSEAHLYAELKRLVERGHAEAEVVDGQKRQRTRYTITAQGRSAFEDWLGTAPAPPSLEVETLLRTIFADMGSADDLRMAIEETRLQILERRAIGIALTQDLLTTGGPFPDKLHLTERGVTFYADFMLLLLRWCDQTLADIDTWKDTRDVGLTSEVRERLERVIKLPDH